MADDYRTTEVGERYAQALFDLADETGALEPVRADLASLRAAWNESADLRRLAQSPVIAAEDQQKGLTAIADKAKFNGVTRNFLGLLAQNGRARDLTATVAAFEARAAPAGSPAPAARSPCSAIVSCASIQVAWVLGKWSTGTVQAPPDSNTRMSSRSLGRPAARLVATRSCLESSQYFVPEISRSMRLDHASAKATPGVIVWTSIRTTSLKIVIS